MTKEDLEKLAKKRSKGLKRGKGLTLSTVEDNQPGKSKNQAADENSRRNNEESEERVNRGVLLPDSIWKQIKLLAVKQDRFIYEVMQDALEAYIEEHAD